MLVKSRLNKIETLVPQAVMIPDDQALKLVTKNLLRF